MKPYLVLFSCLSLTTFAQRNLSLQDALSLAQQNQPTYRNFLVDEQLAVKQSQQTRTRMKPQVNGNVDGRGYLKRQTLVLPVFLAGVPGQTPNGEFTAIPQGTIYQLGASAELTQTIFDPTYRVDRQTGELNEKLAQTNTQTNRLTLKLNVARAYYTALLNAERTRQTARTLIRRQGNLRDAQVRFENQRALQTDVQRARIDYTNALLDDERARRNVDLALVDLRRQIGLADTTLLTLTDQLNQLADTTVAIPASADPTQRPDYRAEDFQRILSTKAIQKTRRQYLPTVSANAVLAAQGFNDQFLDLLKGASWFPYAYIGLRASVPIYDGGQKRNLQQQQQLQVIKNETNLQNIRANYSYEAASAAKAFADARRAVTLQADNLRVAESLLEQAQVRLANQLGTTQAITDAETTLQDSQFNYLQALYDLANARLDWLKANGSL